MAGLGGGVAAFVALTARWHGWFDLRVYHGAVRLWLDGGDLYAYREPGPQRNYGFTYPPFAAVCFVPLALLPFAAALAVITAASVAGSAALLWVWFRRWLPVMAGLILLVALEPWRDTLSFGQINLVLLALVGLDLLVLRRGPLVGLAVAVKLTPALFIGYLLIARRYREAFVAAGTALAATGVAWLVAPGASRRYWSGLVWQVSRVGRVGEPADQSLAGALHRLHAPAEVWPLLALAVLLFWWTRVQAAGDWAGLALTGIAMCLVSPITWVHHLVWELPALLLLWDRLRWVAVALAAVLALRLVWLVPSLSLLTLTGLVLLAVVPRDRTSDVSS
ncbi:glycosyltransferase 87 family protein [Dactylosporangium sp. CA-092794]|uniref:glycosyltransferase 87 family protein n=1 Tax=Dactylosporangium sp. CA-092794 TaxID=3239929 RepID=UPI003D91A6C2